jgi:hypothetical protein
LLDRRGDEFDELVDRQGLLGKRRHNR